MAKKEGGVLHKEALYKLNKPLITNNPVISTSSLVVVQSYAPKDDINQPFL